DVPVLSGCCNHQGAPSWGIGVFAVKRFYHTSPALSTPHRRSLGHPHPPHLPLSYGDFRGLENENSYTLHILEFDKAEIPAFSQSSSRMGIDMAAQGRVLLAIGAQTVGVKVLDIARQSLIR